MHDFSDSRFILLIKRTLKAGIQGAQNRGRSVRIRLPKPAAREERKSFLAITSLVVMSFARPSPAKPTHDREGP